MTPKFRTTDVWAPPYDRPFCSEYAGCVCVGAAHHFASRRRLYRCGFELALGWSVTSGCKLPRSNEIQWSEAVTGSLELGWSKAERDWNRVLGEAGSPLERMSRQGRAGALKGQILSRGARQRGTVLGKGQTLHNRSSGSRPAECAWGARPGAEGGVPDYP